MNFSDIIILLVNNIVLSALPMNNVGLFISNIIMEHFVQNCMYTFR